MQDFLRRLFPASVEDHVLVLRQTAKRLRKLCEAQKGAAEAALAMHTAALAEADRADRIAAKFDDLLA